MGRNSSVGTRTTSTGLSEGAFPAEITSIEAIERREAGGSGIVVGLRCRLDPDSGAPQIGDGISTLFEGDDSISGKVSYGAMEVEFTGVNTGAHEAKIRLRPSKGGVLANDVIISPDGYLGLGNQDPTSILHIFAPSTALASNQILVTNANAKVWTYQHGSPSNDDWSLGSTDAGTVLYIEQDTGQVGINRTDPGYTVDIATATNVGLNIDGSGQASGQPTQIRLVDGDSAVTTLSAVAGKMGINTSSPDFALQVNAGASQVVSEFYGTTASSFLSIASSSEAISNNTGIAFSAYPGGVLGSYCSTAFIQSYVVQSSPTLKGNLIFVTNSGDQTYEAMRIDENQFVGIGNTSPSSYSGTTCGLIVGDTTRANATIQIATSTGGAGYLGFTDTADSTMQGLIEYEHSTANAMKFHTAGNEKMRLSSAGVLLIGQTTTSEANVGVVINQGGHITPIMVYMSSAFTHGLSAAQENVYFKQSRLHPTQGGIMNMAFGTGVYGYAIQTTVGSHQTTRSTSGYGPFDVDTYLKSGSSQFGPGANVNIVTFRSGGATRFIFDSEGDSHQDVGTTWTNFDWAEDAQITRSLGIFLSPETAIQTRWDDWGRDHRALIEEVGLMPKLTAEQEARGERGLVNTSLLQRIHNGAIWQLHSETQELREMYLEERAMRISLESRLSLLEN